MMKRVFITGLLTTELRLVIYYGVIFGLDARQISLRTDKTYIDRRLDSEC